MSTSDRLTSDSTRLTCTKPLSTLLLATMTSALITACGGGSGDSSAIPQSLGAADGRFIELPADTISRSGMITLTGVNGQGFAAAGLPAGVVGSYGEFIDHGSVLGGSFLSSEFAVGKTDTCQITSGSRANTTGDGSAQGNHFSQMLAQARRVAAGQSAGASQRDELYQDAPTAQLRLGEKSIEAGQVLTITTPSGSWPDLVLQKDPEPYYQFEEIAAVLGDAPAGTKLNIPGAEFPAFSNLTIPQVARFSNPTLTNTNGDRVSPDTRVTWTVPPVALAGTSTAIVIDSEILGASGSNSTDVLLMICTVTEDGGFSFPESYRELFDKYQITRANVALTRLAMTSKVQGNAAVIAVNSSVYFFQ